MAQHRTAGEAAKNLTPHKQGKMNFKVGDGGPGLVDKLATALVGIRKKSKKKSVLQFGDDQNKRHKLAGNDSIMKSMRNQTSFNAGGQIGK